MIRILISFILIFSTISNISYADTLKIKPYSELQYGKVVNGDFWSQIQFGMKMIPNDRLLFDCAYIRNFVSLRGAGIPVLGNHDSHFFNISVSVKVTDHLTMGYYISNRIGIDGRYDDSAFTDEFDLDREYISLRWEL